MDFSEKKVAIVADWLIDFGGAELVIQELLDMFPQAEIFTSVCFMDHPMLKGRKIHTSFIQKIPFLNRKHKLAGILRPWAFRRFDLSEFDIVICSSSAESKNVACGKWRKKNTPIDREDTRGGGKIPEKITPLPPFEGGSEQENFGKKISEKTNPLDKGGSREVAGGFGKEIISKQITPLPPFEGGSEQENFSKTFQTQEVPGDENFSQGVYCKVNDQEKFEGNAEIRRVSRIYCYCHTPIRYYWSHYEEYKKMMEFGKIGNFLAKIFLPLVVNKMRKMDYEAAQAVDVFWANSKTTAERIKTYYHRDAEVIYPGVNEANFSHTENKKDFYFGIGRCIPYKKFDLLVDAFNTNGKPLKLATNTDNVLFRELKEKSKPNIEWIFSPSNEERKKLYSEAKAFLFPPEEDFGLVPVEAMISGTPVIAYGVGGGTESVIDGKTGVFFTPQTPEALGEAIERFENMSLSQAEIIARGQEFSTKVFREKILKSLEKYLKNE